MSVAPARADLAGEVVDALRSTLGRTQAALHEPLFAGNEWQYLKECLDSTFVSSVGQFVDRLERDLADYVGARRAVAVVNGTAALHVALELAGVTRDDEVLIPTFGFVATANAVSYCGAVPHLVDSEERTLGMDPAALREHLKVATEMRDGRCVNRATGRVVRAVVPMHTFGHPVDIDGMLSVARDFRLALVEDAAESLGSMIGSHHVGTYGMVATLSFNGNKTVTTGGGGAIITNDEELGRRAKYLTTTARTPHRWEFVHDEIGYNHRMPNLNAALGCAQLEQLPGFVEKKRALFSRYEKAFAGVPGCRIFREPEGCRSNYWLQALILDESSATERDAILTATNDAGFGTRPAWVLMHRLKPYAASPRMELPVAESLARRIINLPSSAFL